VIVFRREAQATVAGADGVRSSNPDHTSEEPMLQTLKASLAQDRKHDDGFTLIELMVVVMIIAVLLAIAIPTFLASQNKAKDRSAQSSLRNTLTAAKSIYTDGSDYTRATTTALAAGEPSLTFVAVGTASTDPKTVSVNPASAGVFYAASKSAGGTCYYIKDDVTAGTTYAKGTGTCDGTTAASQTYTAAGWS
jgi:type IV pilus assembly protein PilA